MSEIAGNFRRIRIGKGQAGSHYSRAVHTAGRDRIMWLVLAHAIPPFLRSFGELPDGAALLLPGNMQFPFHNGRSRGKTLLLGDLIFYSPFFCNCEK